MFQIFVTDLENRRSFLSNRVHLVVKQYVAEFLQWFKLEKNCKTCFEFSVSVAFEPQISDLSTYKFGRKYPIKYPVRRSILFKKKYYLNILKEFGKLYWMSRRCGVVYFFQIYLFHIYQNINKLKLCNEYKKIKSPCI